MKRIVFATVAALMATATVQATTISFTSGSPSPFSAFGNSLTKTADDVTVVLTGWSTDLTSDFTASQVKVWSTGVGTCNSGEGLNCGSGPHTVDNDGRKEVLLLTFSQPVLVTEAIITAWASDYDASFWGGTGDPTMNEMNFGDLGMRHDSPFTPPPNVVIGSSWRAVSLTPLATPVDWLVFGTPPDSGTDKFKFKSLTFSVPVPEPGVLALLGIGAALLAMRKR
jgi:hypothetical protein